MTIHKTVLLEEAIKSLNIKEGNIVIDATLGGGGHSLEILKKIGKTGKLIAIDQDTAAIENFKRDFFEFSQSKVICLVRDNFSNLKDILASQGVDSADCILADLGISSDQLENKKRGMSFKVDAKLDMRMDENQKITAKEVVNNWSQKEIEDILKKYGEEKFAKNIAKKIIEARREKLIESTFELSAIVKKAIPRKFHSKKINPATKTFQAIRIAVNEELENLEKFIEEAIKSLSVGGRLAIITFHSLEDRIVKNIFRQNARGCICPPAKKLQDLQKEYMKAVACGDPLANSLEKALQSGPKSFPVCQCGNIGKVKIITKKPIIPSEKEVRNNPRARSAKLRVCEKI